MRLLHLGGGVDGRGSRHREEGGAVRRHADLVAFPEYGAAAASACRQPCSAGGAHTSEEELGSRHGKRAREGQEIRSWADTTMETSEEVPLQRSLVPRRCTGGGRRGADCDPALSWSCGETKTLAFSYRLGERENVPLRFFPSHDAKTTMEKEGAGVERD